METNKSKLPGTRFIHLNTRNCKACWKCIDTCPSNVIGKVDILIHKHVVIKHAENCIGCLKCVKVCAYDALSPIPKVH